jgi:hypothetical protein
MVNVLVGAKSPFEVFLHLPPVLVLFPPIHENEANITFVDIPSTYLHV